MLKEPVISFVSLVLVTEINNVPSIKFPSFFEMVIVPDFILYACPPENLSTILPEPETLNVPIPDAGPLIVLISRLKSDFVPSIKI